MNQHVALPGDALGKTNLLKHQFRLKEGITLIYIPAYRLPHSKLATVDKLIDEMLSQDVIEPSTSEWNFPLILDSHGLRTVQSEVNVVSPVPTSADKVR